MSVKRNIYLNTVEIKTALEKIKSTLHKEELVQKEKIESHLATGRVLSEPVYALYSAPTFHCAAMDGYAVKAETTFTARENEPLFLASPAQCLPVNTGNPLPAEFDAVIMIEQVQEINKDQHKGISIDTPVFPYQHVRRIGEDIIATELLFPQEKELKAWDIAALLSGGIWEVNVFKKIKVCIIPSGDEVLDFMNKPQPQAGQVIESNSQMIAAMLNEIGCIAERIPPVPDKLESLQTALDKALNSDYHIVIFCAGSSAGSKDFTRATIESRGEILVHGIAAMPGKPSILGVCKNKLVVGAPGYPVSTLVCIEELVIPLVSWLAHKQEPEKQECEVLLTRKTPSKLGTEEFLRLAVGKVGETLVATPLSRGAGNITSVCRSQAVASIPMQVEGLNEGTKIKARLTTHSAMLDKTIVCVGSHDNTLDVLYDELMKIGYAFTSTHVGSTGGITALKNHACHFAGMHLYDPETNDFNFPFLNKLLPNEDLTVINLALRHQGLIVAKHNPLNIQSIHDLTKVRFLNRQKGSGTRILFDNKLKELKIAPNSIQGYDKEEYTHMAVAVNVLTGTIDCGMGIQAAAQALNLDFVPIALERYDLVIPTSYMQDSRIKAVLQIINSDNFKERITKLGGYEITHTGQTMQENIPCI